MACEANPWGVWIQNSCFYLPPGVEVFVRLPLDHASVGGESCQQGQEPAPFWKHLCLPPPKKKTWQLAEKLILPHHRKAGNFQFPMRLDYVMPRARSIPPLTRCRLNLDFSWVLTVLKECAATRVNEFCPTGGQAKDVPQDATVVLQVAGRLWCHGSAVGMLPLFWSMETSSDCRGFSNTMESA